MMVSEGGRSLSGGQKQAIGLARVLLRKPRNSCSLTSPPAHFDTRSEMEFLERLKGITTGDHDDHWSRPTGPRCSISSTGCWCSTTGTLVQTDRATRCSNGLRGSPAAGGRPGSRWHRA